jgi:trigger factor
LNSQIQILNESERKISFEMPKEETEKYFEEILKEESKKLTIPGFRKGKAPLSLVRKMYGEALFYENLEKIANNRFWDEIDTLGIEIIGVPKLTSLDITDDMGLKFDIEFEVIPEIDFSKLDKILAKATLEKNEYELSDNYINEILTEIQFQNRTEEKIDVVNSNDVIVEAKRIEETENSKHQAKDFLFYLNHKYINPNFRDLFLNKKVGDKINTNLEPILVEKKSKKEKNVSYQYEIKKIYKVILPELTDELIKKISKGEIETLDAFKQYLIQEELKYYQSKEEKSLKEKIKELLVDNFELTPPPSMLEQTVNDFTKEMKTKEPYNKLKDDELSELVKPIAEDIVIWFIIKKSLIKYFNLNLTEEELNEYTKKLADKYKLPIEKIKNYLKKRGENLLEELLEDKIYNFLKPKIKIKTQKVVL